MLGEVLSDGGQSFYVLAGTQLSKWVVNNNSEKVSKQSCFFAPCDLLWRDLESSNKMCV